MHTCKTFDRALNKDYLTKLNMIDLPNQFRITDKLKRVLVATRNLFRNVTVIPKDQSQKFKRSICNTPIDKFDVACKSLPKPPDCNVLLSHKLKYKAEYHSHVS